MATILHVSQGGNAAIYRASNPDAFGDPVGNIADVFFHSALDYLTLAETVSASIDLPSRSPGSSDTWWGGEQSISDGGSAVHAIGTASTSLPAPLVASVDGAGIGVMTVLQMGANSFRTIGLGQDGQDLKLYENWYVTSGNIAARTVSVNVFLFADVSPVAGVPLFEMDAAKVTAGQRKLDSRNSYLIADNSGSPSFQVPTGVTIDVENGGARYVHPDGTTEDFNGYGGGFTDVNWQGART